MTRRNAPPFRQWLQTALEVAKAAGYARVRVRMADRVVEFNVEGKSEPVLEMNEWDQWSADLRKSGDLK